MAGPAPAGSRVRSSAVDEGDAVCGDGSPAGVGQALPRPAPGEAIDPVALEPVDEVEVTTLEQLRDVLDAGADQVLLDNMPTAQMAEAVDITAGRAKLEASGGLSLDRAREVAETGVDFLAVGALTHSAPVLDIAMDLRTGNA